MARNCCRNESFVQLHLTTSAHYPTLSRRPELHWVPDEPLTLCGTTVRLMPSPITQPVCPPPHTHTQMWFLGQDPRSLLFNPVSTQGQAHTLLPETLRYDPSSVNPGIRVHPPSQSRGVPTVWPNLCKPNSKRMQGEWPSVPEPQSRGPTLISRVTSPSPTQCLKIRCA